MYMVLVQNQVLSLKTCSHCNGAGQINVTQDTPFGRMVKRTRMSIIVEGTGKIIQKNVQLVMEQVQ